MEAAELVSLLGTEDNDLQIAVKGIVKERPLQQKKVKPDLVIEDGFEIDYL